MLKIFSHVLLTILLFCGAFCLGQRLSSFSTRSPLFSETIELYNPALSYDSLKLSVGNVAFSAPFENIRQYYAAASAGFGSDGQHGFGVSALQFARGELIRETGVKLGYRYSLDVSSSLRLSLGFMAGVYQFGLTSTINTDGASDLNFNMDWSLGMSGENFKVGVGLENLTQPELVLIDQPIVYARGLTVFGEWKKHWNEKLLSQVMFHSRHLSQSHVAVVGIRNVFYEHFLIGVFAGNENFSGQLGYVWSGMKKAVIHLSVGYMVPVFKAYSAAFTPFQVHLAVFRMRRKINSR